MTLDGNHIQIPNSTIYNSTIQNFTANPNLRIHFAVGIGYEDAVSEAQTVIHQVLQNHPAVLRDPEPMVLVDSLGAATVNIRVYFWMDGSEHSAYKVKSSVIRLSKVALQEAGISLPDESREVVFPAGVPVSMLESPMEVPQGTATSRARHAEADQHVATEAEGGLDSEAKEIEEQAANARVPDKGENLLQMTKQ